MAEVFVSYARGDRPRAKELVEILEAEGFEVFWDRELVPGPSFRQVIGNQLAAARCVVALWTRASVTSDWVIDEAEQGRRRRVLVSVRLDDVDLPLGFRQGQAADLRCWRGEREGEELELLLHGIRRLVREPAPPVPPPPVRDFQPPQVLGLLDHVEPPPRASRICHPALGPTLLLAGVFVMNLLQTAIDPALAAVTPLGAKVGYPVVEGFRWFEGGLSFDGHDATNALTYVGYSIAYFFVFPALAVGTGLALVRRADPRPYRAFSLAVAINYLVSLPFFLLLPVPERWFQPDTAAMLLSDKWTEALIEAIRPMSALDNSFPSFHVSLTVLIVAACFAFHVRLRTCVAALGGTVVLATFALGIHWVPDMIAGACLGFISLVLATRCVDAPRFRPLWSVSIPVASGRPWSSPSRAESHS